MLRVNLEKQMSCADNGGPLSIRGAARGKRTAMVRDRRDLPDRFCASGGAQHVHDSHRANIPGQRTKAGVCRAYDDRVDRDNASGVAIHRKANCAPIKSNREAQHRFAGHSTCNRLGLGFRQRQASRWAEYSGQVPGFFRGRAGSRKRNSRHDRALSSESPAGFTENKQTKESHGARIFAVIAFAVASLGEFGRVTAAAPFLIPLTPFPTAQEPCAVFAIPSPESCTLSTTPDSRIVMSESRRQRVCLTSQSNHTSVVRAWCRDVPNSEIVLGVRTQQGEAANMLVTKPACSTTSITVSHPTSGKSIVFVFDKTTNRLLWSSGVVNRITHGVKHEWNATLLVQIVPLDVTLSEAFTTIYPGVVVDKCQPKQVVVFNWEVADATWTAAMYSFLVASFVTVTMLGSVSRYPLVRMLLVTTLLLSHVPVLHVINFTSYVISTVLGCLVPPVVLFASVVLYIYRRGVDFVLLPPHSAITRIKEAAMFIVSSLLALLLFSQFALY